MSLGVSETGLGGVQILPIGRTNALRNAFLAAAGVSAALQTGLAFALARALIGPATFLVAHVILCGALLGTAIVALQRSEDGSNFLHLALWSTIGGPYGAVIAGGLLALDWHRAHQPADFGDWLDLAAQDGRPPTRGRLCNAYLDGRLRILGASGTRPLGEILAAQGRE
ncbi:hypothetical protein, partial [Methylobacterium soli]